MRPKLDFTVSTVDQVYDWLRETILIGELPPSTRLSEAEIAGQFGISRQPVREAFIRLTADGLAEVRPQRGTYVSRISISAVLSARLIREAVESDLIRTLAKQADETLIVRLDDEIAQQRTAVAQGDADLFVRLDDTFHHMLAVAVEQEAVWTVLERLKSQMNRLRYISARSLDIHKLIDQHAQIVDGLRARDPDLAEQAMRRHLHEVLNDLPEISRSHPELFIPLSLSTGGDR